MKRVLIVPLLVYAALLTGCATVTATPNNEPKTATPPDLEETQPFYAWGLVPEKHTVDVQSACPGGVRQLQAQTTGIQAVLSHITFGIYMPRTARVWCQ